jgi:hypothetical protein
MKNIVLCFWLLIVLGITSCKRSDKVAADIDSNGDPLKEYTLDLQQAKMWLPGKWKLIKVSAMIPNPPVPNIELIAGENQIIVMQDGIKIDQVDYEVIRTDYSLLIKTNAAPKADNWYVRNPSLYINKNRMYLDLGRAQDMPGYEFKKVN